MTKMVFATTLDGPEEPNEALTFDLFEEDHFQDMEDLSEFPEYDPERYPRPRPSWCRKYG